MIQRLPKSDVHYSMLIKMVQIASHPLIKVQQVFLLEKFIQPILKFSQSSDKELHFGPGYLVTIKSKMKPAELQATEMNF